MDVTTGHAVTKGRAKAPARSVTVTKQPKQHGPFMIDSDSDSDSSSDNEAEEKEHEVNEDDEDDWGGIPPRSSPPKLSLEKRTPVSGTSSNSGEPVNISKLRAILLAKRQGQPKGHASTSHQIVSQPKKPTSVAAKPVPSHVNQRPVVSELNATSKESNSVRKGVNGRYSLGTSKSLPAPRAASGTTPSGETNRGAVQARSSSTKPASNIPKATQIDRPAPNSTPKSGPNKSLPKEPLDATNGFKAVSQVTSTKGSIQGVSSSARPRSGTQNTGGAGLIGSLIEGIRQTVKQHDASTKATPEPTSIQSKQPIPVGQTQICSLDSGTGRSPVTQAQAGGTASSGLHASRPPVSTLKRKAEPTRGSSSLAVAPYKKPNRTATQPLFTLQSTAHARVDVELGALNDPERGLKPSVTALSPSRMKPDPPALTSRSLVYRSLQTSFVSVSQHKDQPATSSKDLTTTKPRLNSSVANKVPVQARTQVPPPSPDTTRKTALSVVIPGTARPLVSPLASKDATTNQVMDTSPSQKKGQTSGSCDESKTLNADPKPYTSVAQPKAHQVPTHRLDNPKITTDRISDGWIIAKPAAKKPEGVAKRSVAGLNNSQPPTVNTVIVSATESTEQDYHGVSDSDTSGHVGSQRRLKEQAVAREAIATSNRSVPDARKPSLKEEEKYVNVTDNIVPTARHESQLCDRKESSKASAKVLAEQSSTIGDTTKGALDITSVTTAPTTTTLVLPPNAAKGDSASRINPSNLPPVSADAEPYFEYSVLTKIWSDSEDEASADTTELISTLCTNIEEANTHAEKLFINAREQYQKHFQVQFSEWSNKLDEHGCNVFVGTFAPIEYPRKKSRIMFWVERHAVSALADRTAKEMKNTSFVAKTVYMLRLCKLIPMTTESDIEAEEATKIVNPFRVYHPLPRTECYTTLDAANRAAKSLQIEMSHKPNPQGMDIKWQEKLLEELNQKATALRTAKDEEARYWKSEFNSLGLGSARFELTVEKAGLCGPRNL